MSKQGIYISLFVLLGVLVSFLMHAGIEIPVIYLLVNDFATYSLGLTWDAWYTIHAVGSVVLLLLGLLVGFQQGRYWWRVIYVERRYPWLFKQ